jgi:hypothetical protein
MMCDYDDKYNYDYNSDYNDDCNSDYNSDDYCWDHVEPIQPHNLYYNPKSLTQLALKTYVLKNPIPPKVDVIPSNIPSQLEWVHHLFQKRCIIPNNVKYKINVQHCSLLMNDSSILWKLYNLGFRYEWRDECAAVYKKLDNSLQALKKMNLWEEMKKEDKRILDIQRAAVLFDDASVLWRLCKINKLKFTSEHFDLALNEFKHNSLEALAKMDLRWSTNYRMHTGRTIESDAMKLGNIEGLKILIKYHIPTIIRLILEKCFEISYYQPRDESEKEYNEYEKLEILRFIRDIHKIDINYVFSNGREYDYDFITLKGLDDPTEEYKYPRHIDFSPNMDYYEYFISRGLVPSSRLFVFTKDYEIIETLLKDGLRPTELDIYQSNDLNKLKLYRKYGVYVNLSNVLMKPEIDLNYIEDNIFNIEKISDMEVSMHEKYKHLSPWHVGYDDPSNWTSSDLD